MDDAPRATERDDPELATVGDAITAARPTYEDLAALAEEIEDEWSYVTDLAAAWTERMDDVATARGDERVGQGLADAVRALSAEAAAVDDPHRAIDWLSTYPQVLLVALGERP